MNVVLSSEIGFCFGVKRAVKMTEDLLSEVGKAYVVGSLIHNPLEMKRLSKKGLISVSSVEEIPPRSAVIIRSHGIPKEDKEKLLEMGGRVVDATCPFVRKVQDIAKDLVKDGYRLLIYGDPKHPEIKGILSHLGEEALVIHKEEDLDFISPSDKIGLVSQTTQELDAFLKIAATLSTRVDELRVFNTICDATIKRRRALLDLASKSDIIIVVGGKNSSNTCKLVELAAKHMKKVYHIESPIEISRRWFEGVKVLGLASGASTPDWQIRSVLAIIRKYGGEVNNGDNPNAGGNNLSY